MTSYPVECWERLRRETSLAYRMILTMLPGVEDATYAELSETIDVCDGVMATERDWSIREWQDWSGVLGL